MSQEGTWATETEIFAAAKLLVFIFVYSPMTNGRE
jgi:hypothetical protein